MALSASSLLGTGSKSKTVRKGSVAYQAPGSPGLRVRAAAAAAAEHASHNDFTKRRPRSHSSREAHQEAALCMLLIHEPLIHKPRRCACTTHEQQQCAPEADRATRRGRHCTSTHHEQQRVHRA